MPSIAAVTCALTVHEVNIPAIRLPLVRVIEFNVDETVPPHWFAAGVPTTVIPSGRLSVNEILLMASEELKLVR